MLLENDSYSDVTDPNAAPFWAFAVGMQKGVQCLMRESYSVHCHPFTCSISDESLLSIVNMTKCQNTIESVLGIEDNDHKEAFGRLTTAPAVRSITDSGLNIPTLRY